MGLDFSLYEFRKADGPAIEQCKQADSWQFFEAHELAYGRKAWELVHALGCSTQGDCFTELTIDNWINLMEKLGQIGPYLEDIAQAYQKDNPTVRDEILMKMYEDWHKKTFDGEYPQLGYDFSVGYIMNFWTAGDRVIDYLENPEYEVWMNANY